MTPNTPSTPQRSEGKNNNSRRSFHAPRKGAFTRTGAGSSSGHHGSGNKTRRHFRSGGANRPERRMSMRTQNTDGAVVTLPDLADNIRIVHFGGVEEVGRNMCMIEIGDDIILIDAGIQFSEESTPGIDYILPNSKYVEERRHKIRALLVTHGHLDHIGGIPYLITKLGNPPIYARNFTSLMIKKRQEEFPDLAPLDLRVIEKGDVVTLGKLKVKFFAVTHSIPDAMGIIIETAFGDIVHTGDLRLDHTDEKVSEIEDDVYKEFKDRNVLLLQTDSTNAENPGFSISENLVQENIESIIRDTKSRLIVSTYASQVERMLKILEFSEKHGKKVVVDGRSMKTNIEVVKAAGLLTVKPQTIITVEEMSGYPEEKLVLLVTGAQGEEFAALMRISNKTHKYVRLSSRDTVLMSSSIVPGNERSVQKLKDNISRQEAHIIHYKTSDIHSSGHANSEELAWIHAKIKPKFFIPIHGYHYMHRVHADIAKRIVKPENIIIPDNGMVVEIREQGQKIVALKESVPKNIIMVDGFSVGDMQEVVLRDRQILAQDGMFVVVAALDTTTGKLHKSPDIISRGCVYLKESQDLLHQVRTTIKKTIEDAAVGMNPINFDYIKSSVTDNVAKLVFQRTAKRPIVIPVVLGI